MAALPGRGPPSFAGASLKSWGVVGFKTSERSIEHFPARHDHDVEALADLVPSEDLAREAFRAIPLDRRSQFPGGGHAESSCSPAIGDDEQRHETAVNSDAARVRTLEIRPSADPFSGRQSVAVIHRLSARQPPSGVSAPSHGAAWARCDRSLLPFARENHGFSCVAERWVEMSACPSCVCRVLAVQSPSWQSKETSILVGSCRAVKGSEGWPRTLCATVAGALLPEIGESGFGFSPKISTDVENIVENVPLS